MLSEFEDELAFAAAGIFVVKVEELEVEERGEVEGVLDCFEIFSPPPPPIRVVFPAKSS